MNSYYSNTAPVEYQCNVVDMSHLKAKAKVRPSNYTSQGKRKAVPCDPIRSLDDIEAVKNYFLTTGRKGNRIRNYMIFVLGISVGLRGCDLLRLCIRDVLEPNGHIVDEIRVYESKTHKMNYPIVNDVAKEAIARYLDSLDGNFSPDDRLIKAQGKADMDENTLYNIIKKAQTDLELPYNLGAHSLRKTFAYWTIAMHPDDISVLASLQEMLNHDSMKTTLHYAGQSRDTLRTLYTDIGKVFTGEAVRKLSADNNVEDKLDAIIGLLGLNAEG